MEVTFDEAYNGAKKKFSIQIPGKNGIDSISLKLPQGCADGSKLKLKGRGKPAPDGTFGNLIIEVHVLPHKYFSFDEKDIILNLPITFSEATLGTKVEIPTPDGKKLRVRIPKGTQNGSKLTIKGAGAHKKNGTKGNLIAVVEIAIPKDLNKKQKSILEKYSDVEDKGVRP